MRETAPFWSVAALVSESAEPADFQVSLEDMVPGSGRLVDGDLSHYSAKGTPFAVDDVLFGKLRPYLAKYWLADRSGTAGGDIHVYRPLDGVEPRFLGYVVGSSDFVKYAEAASKGTKMPRVEWTGLREFQVSNFDRLTQRRVADFLDRETGEIDAMIAKLDELAEVLETRRAETIKSAFAHGDVICVPTPLFAIALSEDNKRIPLKAEDRGNMSGGYPYYGASGVIDYLDKYIWDNETRVLLSEDGANLLARKHPIAFIASGQYWVNNHAHVLRPETHVDPRLICFAITVTDIQYAVSGSAQPKLTADAMWRLKIPFPVDHLESTTLADHLDEVTGKIDTMLAKIADLKSLLLERRAALITDVVTGRKEVA